jgi:hypothetical protein
MLRKGPRFNYSPLHNILNLNSIEEVISATRKRRWFTISLWIHQNCHQQPHHYTALCFSLGGFGTMPSVSPPERHYRAPPCGTLLLHSKHIYWWWHNLTHCWLLEVMSSWYCKPMPTYCNVQLFMSHTVVWGAFQLRARKCNKTFILFTPHAWLSHAHSCISAPSHGPTTMEFLQVWGMCGNARSLDQERHNDIVLHCSCIVT